MFVCKTYLESLRKIVEECSIRFSIEYHPNEVWTIEGLRKIGTNIREIEELYRLPDFFFKEMSEKAQIDTIRNMEEIEPPTFFLLPSDRSRRLGSPDPLSPIDL